MLVYLCKLAAAESHQDVLRPGSQIVADLPKPEFLTTEGMADQTSRGLLDVPMFPRVEIVENSVKPSCGRNNCQRHRRAPAKRAPKNKQPKRRHQRPSRGKYRNPRHHNSHRRPNPKKTHAHVRPRPKPRPRPVPRRPSPGTVTASTPGGTTKCSMQRRVCGSSCRNPGPRRTNCKVQVEVPQFCFKNVNSVTVCPGAKVKICQYVEKEPSICTRPRRTKVQCPDERYSCDYEVTEKVPCSKPRDDCEKWRKTPCKTKPGRIEEVPCSHPRRPCNDCKGGSYFVKCRRKKWIRTAVPCPLPPQPPQDPTSHPPTVPRRSVSPKPTVVVSNPRSPSSPPYPKPDTQASQDPRKKEVPVEKPKNAASVSPSPRRSPVPFPDQGSHVTAIRCFASFFDESECSKASPPCTVGDASKFDEEKCTVEACRECHQSHRQMSTKLRVWCRVFRARYCLSQSSKPAPYGLKRKKSNGAYSARKVIQSNTDELNLNQMTTHSKRCFKDIWKAVEARCQRRLPGHQICVKGCRVKKCSRRSGSSSKYQGYCRANLPPRCRKKRNRKLCENKRTVKKTCTRPGKKTCDGSLTESYVCSKNKTVNRPCDKQPCNGIFECAKQHFQKKCTQLVKQKYACGTKKELKITPCSQTTGRHCTPRYCTVRVCASRAH